MPDVFLSYSREDQSTARRFAETLQREGFSVWWDQSLRSGESYDEVTEQALKGARAVVVLWSKASVASRWVRAEATIADRAGTLVPVMIENCDRPVMFELRQSADLSGWQGATSDPRWGAFVGDLRHRLQGVAQSAPARSDPVPVRRPVIPVIAIWVVALALIGAGAWALLAQRKPDGAQATANMAHAESKNVTLAVLPFANLSSDPEQEYFVDGMTEELLNSLASIQQLKVTARTSSFYFKGRDEDVKTIGEKLGVEYLLNGSVRKGDGQLRISAQLVKAQDGFQLWSQTYERPLQDIFRVQEEISRDIAKALQVSLGVGDLAQVPGMTRDVQAYQAYLEALSLRQKATATSDARVMEQLELAVNRDPSFLLAWLELNSVYRGALVGDTGPRREELSAQADAAREKVRQLSKDSRFAQSLDLERELPRGGWAAIERGRPVLEEVRRQFRQAAIVRGAGVLAVQSLAVDKASRALPGLERDRTLDPLNSNVSVNLVGAYGISDRMTEAVAELERGIATTPGHVTLAQFGVLLLREVGNEAQLEIAWQRLAALDRREVTARMFELRNRPQEAREYLRSLLMRQGSAAAVTVAQWAGYFRDPELALQALQADDDPQHRTVIALTSWWPSMAAARRLPAFKELVKKIGLVDYWREFGWGEHCRPLSDTDFECR